MKLVALLMLMASVQAHANGNLSILSDLCHIELLTGVEPAPLKTQFAINDKRSISVDELMRAIELVPRGQEFNQTLSQKTGRTGAAALEVLSAQEPDLYSEIINRAEAALAVIRAKDPDLAHSHHYSRPRVQLFSILVETMFRFNIWGQLKEIPADIADLLKNKNFNSQDYENRMSPYFRWRNSDRLQITFLMQGASELVHRRMREQAKPLDHGRGSPAEIMAFVDSQIEFSEFAFAFIPYARIESILTGNVRPFCELRLWMQYYNEELPHGFEHVGDPRIAKLEEIKSEVSKYAANCHDRSTAGWSMFSNLPKFDF